MNAALIDLHVRLAGDNPLDFTTLMTSAEERGLDGIVIVGDHVAPALPELPTNGKPPRFQMFSAVELDTEIGRLVCVPGTVDEWFSGAGWKELASEETGFKGADVVSAFTERGGTVFVAQPYDRDLSHTCKEDAFVGQDGLCAVVVTSSPRHTTSNERAVAAALTAKLPGAGGSASAPDGARFGSVATLFPKAPLGQQSLIAGLKSGRFWPVEITGFGRRKAELKEKKAVANQQTKASKSERSPKKRGRKSKDDNRGNQLDLARVTRPVDNPFDNRQPDVDPIAKLYGLHDRRQDRHQGRTDDELDRVNGNRNRGPDGNVMRAPDFRELRAERQHVNLLLQAIDTQRQRDRDSIALRFAVSSAGADTTDEDFDFDALEPDTPKRNNKRRRRRWR
ncbi:MAG: hypothetical protein KC502_00590 [Myxococcales bacterium]|nr:hypothetical protein [Myxococcales bacterium]